MYTIRSSNTDLCLVPVAFDHMLFSLSQKTGRYCSNETAPVRFESEQNLTGAYLDKLCADIEAVHCPVCLDMRNVTSFVSRGFEVLRGKNLPIIFYGVSEQAGNLKARLQQDMQNLVRYEDEDVFCVKHPKVERLANKRGFRNDVEELYRGKICELLNSVVIKPEDSRRGIFLESSGVYASCYVALKDLFLHMDDALYILYLMAEKIHRKYPRQDDKILICCSKTGAVYTGILSMLLGMKAIYCVNVGPKFALDVARLKKEVQEGQDYIFVFDFLCMGTEAKILHALVSSFGAHLVYGIGVANYLDITAESFKGTIFSRLDTLIDIRCAVSDYTVWPIVNDKSEVVQNANQ